MALCWSQLTHAAPLICFESLDDQSLPGNHEVTCTEVTPFLCPKHQQNMTAYRNRFRMPSKESGGVESLSDDTTACQQGSAEDWTSRDRQTCRDGSSSFLCNLISLC